MSADLADQIDDYICIFDGVGDLSMDHLAMLIFSWSILIFFLLFLAKWGYTTFVKKNGVGTGLTTGTDPSKIGLSPSEKLRKSEPKELAASKDIKGLDLAARPGGRSIIKPPVRSGSSGVGTPTTPPSARKRLARVSPGPELRKPNRYIAPPTNVIGPETSSVTWTSQVFRWLYSDLVIVNELLHGWVQAINDFMKKTVEENGVAVEIVRVLPESPPPTLTNIYCNSEESTPSEMVITLDCDALPVLQIKTFRQKSGKVETSHYKVTISRLRARLITNLSYNTLKGDMKIEGYPDIRIGMNSIGAIKTVDHDEKQLQDVISEILTKSIRDTMYPIDFSIYSTCPRAVEMDPPEIPVNLPIHYDSLAHNMEHLNPHINQGMPFNAVPSGKRLLVKVVKGEGLADAKDPYCVVEMDEPPQKNQTGARQGARPLWDEHFLFDLSPQSAEILFEVYDRPVNPNDPPKFLGLGLVGIDELAVGPSSSQMLTLQPRPYETQTVSGAITVEFVFIEGAEVPAGRRPYKFKEALKITNPSQLNGLQNGTNLANTAIKALEDGALSYNGNPSKSTLIIHSVQRVELNEDGKIQMDESIEVAADKPDNGDRDAETATTASPISTSNKNLDSILDADITVPMDDVTDIGPCLTDDNKLNGELELEMDSGMYDNQPGDPLAQSSPINHHANSHYTNGQRLSDHDPLLDDRGRSKKKRDFFGTLKRRLGRSKNRTKSMDRGMIPIDADNPTGELRSVSADRGVLNSSTNTSTGQRLVVPMLDQSRRSSLSESSAVSGFSSASTKTYLHEASTLVLETTENGVKKHFLVPLAIAQKPRWRRKGVKLHIYNDHTFIAKHLSGGLLCDVCNRSIPRRPGKQGYECRDCLTKCHKQCHVRVPQSCSNPTVLSIELSKLNSAAADRSIRKA